MKNYISVNTKYSKSSNIGKIANHNTRNTDCDYLLNDEDIKYKNIDKVSNSNSESQGGSVNLDEDSSLGGKGTYSDNLAKIKATKSHSSNSGSASANDFISKFQNLQEQKKNILTKKYNYKENDKENTIIEMVVAISEEQAKYYLENGTNLMPGFEKFSEDVKKKYGLEPMGINFHADEGHTKDGVVHNNFHAHLTFYNFDFEKEKTVLRTMKKKDWENMQDLAQNSFKSVGLDFKRGISKGITKKENLKRNDYILQQQRKELKTIKQTIKNTSKKHDQLFKENILEVENINEWQKETKQDLKVFLNQHITKNKANKYEIQDVNEFYHEIVGLVNEVSEIDIKSEELEKEKIKNTMLLQKLNELNKLNNLQHKQNIKLKSENKKIESHVLETTTKEEQRKELLSFIQDKNLKKELDDFLKNDLSEFEESSCFHSI